MIDPASEQNDLTTRAARSLQSDEPLRGYRLADRLCRHFRRPDPRHFLLRAAGARMLGDLDGAASDLQTAFEKAPGDPAVAEAILNDPGAPPPLRALAARAIVQASTATVAGTRAALTLLLDAPEGAVLQARLVEGSLTGWIAWRGSNDAAVHARAADGTERTIVVPPDADHPLAARSWRVAGFGIDIGGELLPHIHCRLGNGPADDTLMFLSREATRRPPTLVERVPEAAPDERRGCAVILPCYDDPDMTSRCLDSLARQDVTTPLSVILVNDRPEDVRLRAILEERAALHGWTLISTAHNLGFVGAVETGLAAADPTADVVLLNADTLLPFGTLERLAVAAYRDGDIGTVTPLSNNGEATSLPHPFTANPLPAMHAVEVFDAIASLKNRGLAPDLPSGVGFCLYVKRACLDAIGGLPNIYHRGYYEDAELCLRARRAGYRNVCAANVYVGHAGSRSFKGEKPSLVARNRRLLRSRFPSFADDSLAFAKRDGLRDARQAVATAAAKTSAISKLLVARDHRLHAVTARASQLRANGIDALILSPLDPPFGSWVALRRHDEAEPLLCRFDVAAAPAGSDALQFIGQLGVRSAEILDDPELPGSLLNGLSAQVAVRFLLDRNPFPPATGGDDRRVPPFQRMTRDTERSLADRPLAMNAMAAAALAAHGVAFVARRPAVRRQRAEPAAGAALGVLYPEASAASERLLRTIVARLEDRALVVLGTTFADASLMAHPGVAVVGTVGIEELDAIIMRQRIGALFAPDRGGGTMLLDAIGARLGLPVAAFDWSHGATRFATDDLGIDPRLGDADAADLVLAWAKRQLRSQGDDL